MRARSSLQSNRRVSIIFRTHKAHHGSVRMGLLSIPKSTSMHRILRLAPIKAREMLVRIRWTRLMDGIAQSDPYKIMGITFIVMPRTRRATKVEVSAMMLATWVAREVLVFAWARDSAIFVIIGAPTILSTSLTVGSCPQISVVLRLSAHFYKWILSTFCQDEVSGRMPCRSQPPAQGHEALGHKGRKRHDRQYTQPF